MHINKLNQLNNEIFLLYYRKICDGRDYSFCSFSVGTNGWQPVGEQVDKAMIGRICTTLRRSSHKAI